jgi:hypothetical protein
MDRKRWVFVLGFLAAMGFTFSLAFSAYHHMGEQDAPRFLAVHPEKAGTKLDNCALCHSGGSYTSGGKTTTLGSCQWCHYKYGYDKSGDIRATLNPYGKAYSDAGRTEQAIRDIESLDSDGDGFGNAVEIAANRYPGDASDDPTKVLAPSHVYTKAQLEAMPQHTQFMLMNTTKSGDFYAEYSGVPIQDLLVRVGIVPSANRILVFSPDGFAQTHPLEADSNPSNYHVNGSYPSAIYYYDAQADARNTGGWCDYSAASCIGRNNGDPISVPGGLRMLLAIRRDGVYLTPGVLTSSNKLDGEGPFRVVPPQKKPGPPDQPSTAPKVFPIWQYDSIADHNAGFSARTATMIKVDPLPTGTTDINVLEAGWNYVDTEKVVVYGAVNGSDSNGNGILDSEEGTDPAADFDKDGIPDFQDPDTAAFKHAYGDGKILMHTSGGDFANVAALSMEDSLLSKSSPPASFSFPFGATKFDVAGLQPGQSISLTMVFPGTIPLHAKYFRLSEGKGWEEIPIESMEGWNTITLKLKYGNALTSSNGQPDGVLSVTGTLAIPDPVPVRLSLSFDEVIFPPHWVTHEQVHILSGPDYISGHRGLALDIPRLSGSGWGYCQSTAEGKFTFSHFNADYGITAQSGSVKIKFNRCFPWLPVTGTFVFDKGPFVGPGTFRGSLHSWFWNAHISGVLDMKVKAP